MSEDNWAVVHMGGPPIIGQLTEVQRGGRTWFRIDVPGDDKVIFVKPSKVSSFHPITAEEAARRLTP